MRAISGVYGAAAIISAVLAAAPALADSFTCSSINYGYNFCGFDTRKGVRLSQQLSRSPCQQGRSWGVQRNGLWVSNGCSASFSTGGGGGSGGAIVGGVVGALLGAAIAGSASSHSHYDNNYYSRPYQPRIPDEPSWVTRQRASDIASQADQQRQRKEYLANQQYQRDLTASQDEQNQRNAEAEANEAHGRALDQARADRDAAEAEARAADERRQGEEDENRQAREAETQENIAQGEADENRQAAGAEASEETPQR